MTRCGWLAIAVALASACGGPEPGVDAGVDAGPGEADAGADSGSAPLAWSPCPARTEGTGEDAECAVLDAPLDHSDPGGARVPIFVRRLRTIGPSRGSLVLVNGGLVSSSVELEPSIEGFFVRVAPDLDIYVFDHRGTGRSTRIACPAAEGASSPGSFSVAPEEAAACLASARAEHGALLDHVDATSAARDLAMLVDRIRVEHGGPVLLYGVSYGSFLIQRYLRIAPDGVDGVVLDGLCNPGSCTMSSIDRDMDALAVRFFAECAADAFCSARLGGDPVATLETLLADLGTGHCSEAAAAGFTQDAVRALIANVLGYAGWTIRPAAAAMVYRLRRCEPRDVAALRVLAGSLLAVPAEAPLAVRYASDPVGFQVAFADLWEVPAPAPADIEAFDATARATARTALRLARVREIWGAPPADEHRGLLADTTVPMLMLHGTLDFVSDASAEMARDHYAAPLQRYVVVPRAPHSTIFAPTTAGRGCAGPMITAFLADPAAPLDTSCTTQIAAIDFTGIGAYAVPLFGTADVWDGDPGP
jgi:pimeloyl-ACP methyl ester carboxylesterase